MPTPHPANDAPLSTFAGSDSELEYLTLLHTDAPTRRGRRGPLRPTGPSGGHATFIFGALIVLMLCVMALGMWFASRGDHPARPQIDSAQKASSPAAQEPV